MSTLDDIICSETWDKSGFLVAMTGQFLTACAQPFLLYAPTMLAGVWFGTKERAICTNFASIGKLRDDVMVFVAYCSYDIMGSRHMVIVLTQLPNYVNPLDAASCRNYLLLYS